MHLQDWHVGIRPRTNWLQAHATSLGGDIVLAVRQFQDKCCKQAMATLQPTSTGLHSTQIHTDHHTACTNLDGSNRLSATSALGISQRRAGNTDRSLLTPRESAHAFCTHIFTRVGFRTGTSMIKPGHNIKRVGLLRAGFQYQDLVAIEVLIDFYRDRKLYQWVQVESEDRSFASIEDVVACRPDGLYELTQVKFTADPESAANHLSWHWLTKKAKSGRSLLQKWSDTTLSHLRNGTLAKAALKTDRIPDEPFRRSLIGTKVKYDLLPEPDRAVIEDQLGSSTNARNFLDSFEFHHSLDRLDDLEERLWSRVDSDTDTRGWHTFKAHVERWATRRNSPEPDGRILHFHLRDAFSTNRSRPLPQDFMVPENYIVPVDSFHRSFIDEISATDGVSVLWGSPGRGKSTYLSHCVASLDPDRALCIRHHYFLSLRDRSEGRFHYQAIRRSLEHQLRQALPELDAKQFELGGLIEFAAGQLAREGRKLVVIIDGLDHVWREHQDQADMQSLFRALLPVPENVHLVVGTQKVRNEVLPSKLLTASPVESWTELPLMDRSAVHQWLRFQSDSGRLKLEVAVNRDPSEELHDVAGAFHRISHGLPLHLIYSFENMMITGKPISASDVSSLPECPDGEIRNYYTSLWEGLPVKAKCILHVLAGLQFGPPPAAMNDFFGHSVETLDALSDIDHLLDRRELEVSPFHASLFAFLREKDSHRDIFEAHAHDALVWLENAAPDYWRWAWLWITKAQLGDTHDLLHAPSRAWAIDSLARGYPVEQLAIILDRAEVTAFEDFNLERFHALRSLSTRARNGPEFQTHEWTLFQEVAVALSPDPIASDLLLHRMRQLPVDQIPIVVRNAGSCLRDQTVSSAISELDRRLATGAGSDAESPEERQDAAYALVQVAAHGGPDCPVRIEDFVMKTREPGSFIASYSRESILAGRFGNVLSLSESLCGASIRRDVLAALCFEGLPPDSWPRHVVEASHAIRCLSLLMGGADDKVDAEMDLSSLIRDERQFDPDLPHDLTGKMHKLFFSALAATLNGRSSSHRLTIPAGSETSWLARAARKLERIAQDAGQDWKRSGHWITLAGLYRAFDLPPDASTRRLDQDWRHSGVRRGLRLIAADIAAIAIGLRPNGQITEEDMQSVAASPYWSDEAWIDGFVSRRLALHKPSAANALVQRIARSLDNTVTEFCERSNLRIQLALFASEHQLVDVARQQLTQAADCLLGYGFRKDPYANDVLETLELLADRGDRHAKQALLDLAGPFEAICEYTDGDETRHFRSNYHDLVARHFPDRVPSCYANLVRNEEWRLAESLSRAVAATDWIDSVEGQALLETFIYAAESVALERGKTQAAENAFCIVQRRAGRSTGLTGQDKLEDEGQGGLEDAHAAAGAPSPPDPDPADHPPARLPDFLEAVSQVPDYDRHPDLVAGWFAHWENAAQGQEVLDFLERLDNASGNVWRLRDTHDAAFELALQIRGRSDAFHWLVRAQTHSAGWSRWMCPEPTVKRRLRHAAETYRGRWKDFVKLTAKPDFRVDAGDNGIVIGLSRLVFFLLEVGQDELARSYALEMVRVFKEELSDQPVRMPDWAR